MSKKNTRPASVGVQKVADACRVTKRTVYNWIDAGELPASKVGRQYRITERQLAEKVGEELADAVFMRAAQDQAENT